MDYQVDRNYEDIEGLALSEFETSELIVEQHRLAGQKAELRNLVHINTELLNEKSEISIAKCLGPIIFTGIISWLLIFRLINHLV